MTKKAFEYGLIIERSGPKDEVIKCLMPLTITSAELVDGLDRLEQAMEDVYGDAVEWSPNPPAPAAVDETI